MNQYANINTDEFNYNLKHVRAELQQVKQMKSWEMQNIRTQVAEIKNMVDYSELSEIKDQLRNLE